MTITDEMIEAARSRLVDDLEPTDDEIRAALTAVAPLIARQVRAETGEECAKFFETHSWGESGGVGRFRKDRNARLDSRHVGTAAAIRALTNEASHDEA